MSRRLYIIVITLIGLNCVSSVSEPSDHSKTPILFVHGYGLDKNSWNKFKKYLIKRGYPREFIKAINLLPNDGANIAAAANMIAPVVNSLINQADSVMKSHGIIRTIQKIDIVAHSMGALSSRWYASKIAPHKVRIWISVAGANHGTNDLCRFNSQGANDCCPAFASDEDESYIQFVLNGLPNKYDVDETPYGIGEDSPGVPSVKPTKECSILYMTVRKNNDEWISPDKSAELDGAGGIYLQFQSERVVEETSPGNILIKLEIGHDELIQHEHVFRIVHQILNNRIYGI